jgi:hypothetical protein
MTNWKSPIEIPGIIGELLCSILSNINQHAITDENLEELVEYNQKYGVIRMADQSLAGIDQFKDLIGFTFHHNVGNFLN